MTVPRLRYSGENFSLIFFKIESNSLKKKTKNNKGIKKMCGNHRDMAVILS